LKKGNCPKAANLDSTDLLKNVGFECFSSMISLIDHITDASAHTYCLTIFLKSGPEHERLGQGRSGIILPDAARSIARRRLI
jgi:hypothetical protein